MELNYFLIGKRINNFRLARVLTVEALAERSGISPQHCSHICNGKTKLSLPCLVNICNALNITPDEILMDNIVKAEHSLLKEVELIYSDCSNMEIRHMLSVSSAIKQSLRISSPS